MKSIKTIAHFLMEQNGRSPSRLQMRANDLVRISEKQNPSKYYYYRVKGFYAINDGSQGVELEGLHSGIVSSSIPIADIAEVKRFSNLREMQDDINSRSK